MSASEDTSIPVEIKEEFNSELKRVLKSRSPLDVVDLVSWLRERTSRDGPIRPEHDHLFATWHPAIARINRKNPAEGLKLATSLYEHLTKLDVDSHGEPIHKGGGAMHLAVTLDQLGQPEQARWFYLLAFIADVQATGEEYSLPKSHALKALQLFEDVSDALLIELKDLVLKHSGESLLNRFPEFFLVLLARAGSPLMAQTSAGGFLNRIFLQALLDEAERFHGIGSKNAKEQGEQSVAKGTAWEQMSAYLVLTLPSTRIIPNVRTYQDEIDIIAAQEADGTNYLVESLGRHFLVEGKNEDEAASVSKLNHFAAKVAFTDCKSGVLISREGITGMGRGKVSDAELARQKWFQRDKFLILVVTGEDLQRLVATQASFETLLREKYREVRFAFPALSPSN